MANYTRLRTLLAESPEQLARLEALRRHADAAWSELAASIRLRQSAGFEASRAALAAGDAGRSFAEVRRGAADLASAERLRLQKRQELTRDHDRSVLWIGVLIAFLSVATRLFIAWLLARLHKQGHRFQLGANHPNADEDGDEALSAKTRQSG